MIVPYLCNSSHDLKLPQIHDPKPPQVHGLVLALVALEISPMHLLDGPQFAKLRLLQIYILSKGTSPLPYLRDSSMLPPPALGGRAEDFAISVTQDGHVQFVSLH